MDVGAGLVVEGAGHAEAAAQDLGSVGVDRRIADAHDGERLRAARDADVDPHVMALGHPLAVLGGEEVHRALAGHAEDGPLAGEDVDAAAGGDDLVVSAEELEVEVAAVVDVRDDEPDLIDVSREHQRRTARALERRDAVADRVALILVGRLLDVGVDHRLSGELVARRGLGLEQLAQELRVVGGLGGRLFGHEGVLPVGPGKSSEGQAFEGDRWTR